MSDTYKVVAEYDPDITQVVIETTDLEDAFAAYQDLYSELEEFWEISFYKNGELQHTAMSV